ncbi:hypothetical protein D1007_31406 [Hordeum vulgare]|nr:hypothetical protein D1007_31406 [Hordeum vulgare]
MAPSEVVAGTSAENEGIKKVKKKKIKKKEDFCGFKMRFNSKWLGDLAQQLSPAKQGIIRNGLFGNLLDIKPFKVPHALIEFVVMHTNHALLEFKYKNKSIKFSKNMVKRIFNVPSGDSPLKLLKKSDEHDLRNIYKEGNIAPIAHVFKLLRDCSDTDEAMIRRTWALVALAIVVCPGTDNMVNLEYLPSLENMDLVHNLAWDEHLLARAMEEVAVFQEKKWGQATIENPKEFQIGSCLPMLEFRTLCNTPYAEVIGPGVDREAATGQGAGAEAANGQGSQNEVPKAQENVEVQPNLSSSFDNWLQQPFPSMDDLKGLAQFQTLYDKHKENFSTEVDDAIRKFGQSLKRLQSSRMAAMLRGVGDAIANTMDEAHEKEKDAQDEAATPTMDEAREKEKDAQDEAEAATPPMDEALEKEKDAQTATACIGDQVEGTVAVMRKDEVIGELEKNQEVAKDAGQTREQQRVSMEVEVHVPPQSPPLFHDAPRSATTGVWDDEPSCELFPKGSEDFNLMHGMDEPTNSNKTCSDLYPNIPVFPVSDDDGSPTIPAQTMGVADEQPIDVGSGPSTHDKNTRKKRMAKVPAIKPKGKKQKSLLKQDPSFFQPNALMAELERAATKFKVQKYDLLWFAIVHERHWIVVCANLLHKQWNAFDSINAKGKPSPLKKQANNLITNFTTLAQECDAFIVNVASFTRPDLEDYPKQNNLCDCGFFAVKYAENFDGKAMKGFEKEDIARYRMEWAYNLIHHPLNTASMELAFREELAD